MARLLSLRLGSFGIESLPIGDRNWRWQLTLMGDGHPVEAIATNELAVGRVSINVRAAMAGDAELVDVL